MPVSRVISPFVRRQRAFYGFGSQATQAAVGTVKGAASGAATGGAIVGATTTLAGAAAGAAAGSVVPIVGTALGAIAGLIASGVFNRNDQEVGNFDQALSMWRQNRLSVLQIANKYLVLAGLMDLNIHTNIPFYKKYGRLGERRFVNDMMTLIYNAAQSGKITASDTPATVLSNVVQPWMDSWGYGPISDPNSDMINLILLGMITDYVTHNEHTWLARGGDYPFGSLPAFSLPAASTVTTSAPVTSSTSSSGPTARGSVMVANASQIGQTVTPGQSISFEGATFSWGSNPDSSGNLNVLRNGADTTTVGGGSAPSRAARLVVANDGALKILQVSGDVYTWNGSQWVPQGNLALPAAAALFTGLNTSVAPYSGVATTPSSTTVPIPAGFTLVGTANGLQAYQGADGNVYTWNGVSMSLLTGTLLMSSGQSVQVINGQVQSAAPVSYGTTSQAFSYPQSSYYPTSPTSTPAAATPTVQAASVVPSGMSSWLVYGAVGVGLWLLFGAKGGKLKHRDRAGSPFSFRK